MNKTFQYVDTCAICNQYKCCRKYNSEFICEDCHTDLNKFHGSGKDRLKQLRESKGIYHE